MDFLMEKENVTYVNEKGLTLTELGLGDERDLVLDLALTTSRMLNGDNEIQFDGDQKYPTDDGGINMEHVIISGQENVSYQKFGEQNQMGVMGI